MLSNQTKTKDTKSAKNGALELAQAVEAYVPQTGKAPAFDKDEINESAHKSFMDRVIRVNSTVDVPELEEKIKILLAKTAQAEHSKKTESTEEEIHPLAEVKSEEIKTLFGDTAKVYYGDNGDGQEIFIYGDTEAITAEFNKFPYPEKEYEAKQKKFYDQVELLKTTIANISASISRIEPRAEETSTRTDLASGTISPSTTEESTTSISSTEGTEVPQNLDDQRKSLIENLEEIDSSIKAEMNTSNKWAILLKQARVKIRIFEISKVISQSLSVEDEAFRLKTGESYSYSKLIIGSMADMAAALKLLGSNPDSNSGILNNVSTKCLKDYEKLIRHTAPPEGSIEDECYFLQKGLKELKKVNETYARALAENYLRGCESATRGDSDLSLILNAIATQLPIYFTQRSELKLSKELQSAIQKTCAAAKTDLENVLSCTRKARAEVIDLLNAKIEIHARLVENGDKIENNLGIFFELINDTCLSALLQHKNGKIEDALKYIGATCQYMSKLEAFLRHVPEMKGYVKDFLNSVNKTILKYEEAINPQSVGAFATQGGLGRDARRVTFSPSEVIYEIEG